MTEALRRCAAAGLIAGVALVGAGPAAGDDQPASTTPQQTTPQQTTPAPTTPAPKARPQRRTIGRAVSGRPIHAWLVGDSAARHTVLVIGCIHGTERAGIAVTRRLRERRPGAGTAWWVIDTVNPDRCTGARVSRGNARGVDLNRNSPWKWRPLDRPGGLFYSGTKALSEPESRAINRFVREVRPDVSIWFHQAARMVNLTTANDRSIVRRYGRAVGLPAREWPFVPGSVATWQQHRFPRATAFVVELPAGPLSAAAATRHLRAIGKL